MNDDLRAATDSLTPPFGVLDADAVDRNVADLRRRAAGKPIRVASKSLRMRPLLEAVLREPGYAGALCYSLREALWLQSHGLTDLVVAYPSVDRGAIRQLGTSPAAAQAITVMIDSVGHLDLMDSAVGGKGHETIRVCLDLDAAYRPMGPAVVLGARRSPVRTVSQAVALARQIASRPGYRLVGIMSYEGQIAGVGNAGTSARARIIRAMQRRSAAELAKRRPEVVAAVRQIAELEFVNGGGTGSMESTAADSSITEIAAGSGLLGPGLFDHYQHFQPAHAAFFVLPVVRRPAKNIVTVAGGGWIASGPVGPDRLPVPAYPPGLAYVGAEGPGEVQTPLRGRAARSLDVGDHVWFRHAKSGEISEHVREFHVVRSGRIVDTIPTYRGEGQVF